MRWPWVRLRKSAWRKRRRPFSGSCRVNGGEGCGKAHGAREIVDAGAGRDVEELLVNTGRLENLRRGHRSRGDDGAADLSDLDRVDRDVSGSAGCIAGLDQRRADGAVLDRDGAVLVDDDRADARGGALGADADGLGGRQKRHQFAADVGRAAGDGDGVFGGVRGDLTAGQQAVDQDLGLIAGAARPRGRGADEVDPGAGQGSHGVGRLAGLELDFCVFCGCHVDILRWRCRDRPGRPSR